MGRLKTIPSRFAVAPLRMGSAPKSEADRSQQRRAETPWRAWYNLARWSKKPRRPGDSYGLRWTVLLRDRFTCQLCGRVSSDPAGDARDMVADHRLPHRGDPALFWDEGNLQCLCKACHDRDKQAAERRG